MDKTKKKSHNLLKRADHIKTKTIHVFREDENKTFLEDCKTAGVMVQ